MFRMFTTTGAYRKTSTNNPYSPSQTPCSEWKRIRTFYEYASILCKRKEATCNFKTHLSPQKCCKPFWPKHKSLTSPSKGCENHGKGGLVSLSVKSWRPTVSDSSSKVTSLKHRRDCRCFYVLLKLPIEAYSESHSPTLLSTA